MANGDGNSGASDLTVPADKIRQLEEVVTERNKIQALIVKAEESRGRVKQEIFDKVLSDYEAKLATVASRYEPVREEIAGHLRRIHAEEDGIRRELTSINDEIEELKFRCDVGEFGPEELAARENEKRVHTQALQEKLDVIERAYSNCRVFLGEDDFNDAIASSGQPAGAPQPARRPPPKAADDLVIADEAISAFPPPPPPPPPPSAPAPADIEVIPTRNMNPEVTLDGLMPMDFDIPPAGDDLVVHDVGRTPPPPPASKPMPAPPAQKPRPTPPPPPPEMNPEMTLAEPLPFPGMQEERDSTLNGGPVPGAPKSSDVEATLSFQHRSFIVLKKEDGTQDTFLLGVEPLSIGRNHRNDVVLLDRSISRKHAEVRKEGGSYVVNDMSSGGGMTVNGEKKKMSALKNGDEIGIGEFKLFYKEEMGF